MLQLFPFLAYLAATTSAVLLAALWHLGEIGERTLIVLLGWFVVAGYCQFFGSGPMVSALGLLGQTVLAVYLLIRWRVE